MRLNDLNVTSVLVALIFVGFGLTVAITASAYPIGTLSQMGPGYFPIACGVLLTLLGILILAFETFSTAAPRAEMPDLRSWFFIISSVLVFASLVETAGFVPAVLCTSLTSLLANPRIRPVSAIVVSAIIAALSAGIFVWALRLNVELFKWIA